MSASACQLTSASGRPLRLRMRPDLKVEQQHYLGRRYWVIKDPLALKYYRFEEEEYALLEMLDGASSPEEIQRRFEKRFASQKITAHELHQLVGMLYHSSLVVSDAPGQGPGLLDRHHKRAWQKRRAAVTHILCVRFRGLDPTRLLDALGRAIGWCFSPGCVLSCLVLMAAALLLVAVQFDVFRQRLPELEEFFAARNWIWLAATLTVTKVCHELGHGLTCRRSGAECHEMGVMLLVFAPCLYCNVSDSWMLPNKWQGAAIGAAGMYVELVLAALCTFLWWFTQPGLLNYLCLNVMFVCSVSTILFNANPLLRFDGYYILSDVIEIPNLRQKASAVLHRKLAAWLLGIPEPWDPFLPQRRQFLFALYSLAAAAYRWVIACGIFWFLYRLFEPQGLKIIGQVIALGGLYGLLLQPLWQGVTFFCVPGRIERVKKSRFTASLVAFAAVAAGVLWIPFPHDVRCGLYLEPRDATAVYVESPGHLAHVHASPGDWVREGQPLLSLENTDIDLALNRLLGERQQLESKLASLRQRAFSEQSAALQVSEAEEALAALDEQLAKRRRDQQRLRITAPTRGIVLAPPTRACASRELECLPTWSGTPLQERNLRAYLEEGIHVCHIGDPRRLQAALVIDQSDLEYVHVGQTADLFLEELPGRKFRSQVTQLSQGKMNVSPQSLSSKAGGQLLTRTDTAGRERPFTPMYQASAPMDDQDGWLFLGATGQARIHTGSQTLAKRMWRYFCQTFHFEA